MKLKTFQRAFVHTLPVFAGYIVLGLGFGILLRVAGFGALWAFFMSVFMFAGSMQYVGVSLLASGASCITVAITTLMVQAVCSDLLQARLSPSAVKASNFL